MAFMRMLKLAIIHSSQRLNRDNPRQPPKTPKNQRNSEEWVLRMGGEGGVKPAQKSPFIDTLSLFLGWIINQGACLPACQPAAKRLKNHKNYKALNMPWKGCCGGLSEA